jgi:two-component system cell cycle response regulator
MSSLVPAALFLRRTLRGSMGTLFAVALAVAIWGGVFQPPLGLPELALAALWLALALPRLWRQRLDLELAGLLLVAIYAALAATGQLFGVAHPVVYLLLAATAALHPAGWRLALVTVAFEALLLSAMDGGLSLGAILPRAILPLLFAGLHRAVTAGEVLRVHRSSAEALAGERARVREESRLFRLAGAPSTETTRDDERVVASSMAEVHDALYHLLELLQRTLGLHTCVLLWRDDDGRSLRIVELATDSDDIAEGALALHSGAVGAVAGRGLPTHLPSLKPGYDGLSYYRGPARVGAFLGVPVREGETLRGALCADRREAVPFTAAEQAVLEDATRQVLRTLDNERVFLQLERSKREQGHLFRASEALGAALTEADVIDAAVAAADALAPHDLVAITAFADGTHRVRRAVGSGAGALDGLTFGHNHSLVAMAVETRHYLPYRGEFDPSRQVVFTPQVPLPLMRSLLVLPLVVGEEARGALVLAAERSNAFDAALRPTVQVLANQLAVALSNADAVRRLEAMATTDGLTGCLNKRAFLDDLEGKLRSAQRFDRELALLVTDIDHFKNVNDTYGHAVGDVVIKELGAMLMRNKRDTDSVARFGGEEFCVLCEGTDEEGAVILAERIREELEQTVFQTEIGPLAVTCSIGIATFPKRAADGQALFEQADRALYAAKRSGRNRVCV